MTDLDALTALAAQQRAAPLAAAERDRRVRQAELAAEGRRRRRTMGAATVTALALAAAAALFLSPPRGAPSEVRLESGDRLVVGEGARFEPRENDRDRMVRLRWGEVLFDVAPVERGSFRVETPTAEVLVIGTVFAVRVTEGGTDVHVFEGRVEVRSAGASRVLGAGETWTTDSTRSWPTELVRAGEAAARRRNLEARRRAVAAPDRGYAEAPPSEERPPRQADVAPPEAESDRPAPPEHDTPPPPRLPTASTATRWIATGAPRRALAAARARIARGERDPWLLIEGDALRAVGQPAAAVRVYRRAVTQTTGETRVQAGLQGARMLIRRGEHAAAVTLLRRSGSHDDGSPLAEPAVGLEVAALRAINDTRWREVASAYLRRWPAGPRAAGLRHALAEAP
ncbi:MAG: FecR domain-containing protein [Sandaracinaceae bacterium]